MVKKPLGLSTFWPYAFDRRFREFGVTYTFCMSCGKIVSSNESNRTNGEFLLRKMFFILFGILLLEFGKFEQEKKINKQKMFESDDEFFGFK